MGTRWALLIRIVVGGIFVSEGLQKFIFPEELGVGRFTDIGIVYPNFTAPFVGVVEIVCGLLLLLGFYTRWATLPVIISMLVAISTTKLPLLGAEGFWTMAHEARTDFLMLFGLVFLLLEGAGEWSLDDRRS
jgi:uncharacterized membrane protein YphA (DoxX/SURF4 family)